MLNITTGALPLSVNSHEIVPFTNTRVRSHRADRACNCRCGWFVYNEGSGQIELVNDSNQARVFEILFNGNITNVATASATTTSGSGSSATPAAAAAAPAGALTVAIMLNGEAIGGTEMDYTPATAGVYGNVSANTLVQVPCGASVTVSVANTGTDEIMVSDGNLIALRIA